MFGIAQQVPFALERCLLPSIHFVVLASTVSQGQSPISLSLFDHTFVKLLAGLGGNPFTEEDNPFAEEDAEILEQEDLGCYGCDRDAHE